jgi:hypothetical protein
MKSKKCTRSEEPVHFLCKNEECSLRFIKNAILTFEKNPTKIVILEKKSNYLPN